LQQVSNLFQSDYTIKCDIAVLLSNSSTFFSSNGGQPLLMYYGTHTRSKSGKYAYDIQLGNVAEIFTYRNH